MGLLHVKGQWSASQWQRRRVLAGNRGTIYVQRASTFRFSPHNHSLRLGRRRRRRRRRRIWGSNNNTRDEYKERIQSLLSK